MWFERKPNMSTEDMDYYEYEESKKRFSAKKITKFIFSSVAAVVIVTVFVLIIARINLIKIPSAFTGLTFTDAAAELWESGKEFDYIFYPLGETYGPSRSSNNYFDSSGKSNFTVTDGLYHVSNIAMSPSTGEVQFTVRYNKRSTVNTLMDFYNLSKRPEGELFVYRLTDSFGNVYTDYVFAQDSNPMQEYRRVIFRGVKLDDLIAEVNPADTTVAEGETVFAENGDKLTLHIYYGEDAAEHRKMNAEFTLYDSSRPYEEPTFKNPEKTTLSFTDAPYYEYRSDEN